LDSVPKRVHDFLVRDGRLYCDACIQKHVGLKWRAQAQLVVATLAVTAHFKCGIAECCACHEIKRVVQAVPRTGAAKGEP
jgi:hypothetical protein